MRVGIIKDRELCEQISESHKNQPIVFWQIDAKNIPEVHTVEGSDSKEILDKILNILPTPPLLDEKKFHVNTFKLASIFLVSFGAFFVGLENEIAHSL